MPPKNLSFANRLIAALPTVDRTEFLRRGELVELPLYARLASAGELTEGAWFPVDGFVSAMVPAAGPDGVAVAQVGHEGMLPAALALGLPQGGFDYRVQMAGRAFFWRRESFAQFRRESPRLREVLGRYVHFRLQQAARQSICTSHHSVSQRLVRALLAVRDRVHSTELFLTQEVLARMLGVRRESVTQAASALQWRGLVSYSRGYLMLLDEAALAALACPCYEADLCAYEQAMSTTGLQTLAGLAVAGADAASIQGGAPACRTQAGNSAAAISGLSLWPSGTVR